MNRMDVRDNSRQRKVAILAYVASYRNKNGFSPTIREIGEAVGLASTSSVCSQIRALEKLGLLKKSFGRPRTYTVNEDTVREMMDDPIGKMLTDTGRNPELVMLGVTAHIMIEKAKEKRGECAAV